MPWMNVLMVEICNVSPAPRTLFKRKTERERALAALHDSRGAGLSPGGLGRGQLNMHATNVTEGLCCRRKRPNRDSPASSASVSEPLPELDAVGIGFPPCGDAQP